MLNIRKKYLPREETKMEELMRLDRMVQSSGMIESLSAGIGGALVFGLGMCLSMKVIGNAMWLGMIGAAGMLIAYPVYRKIFEKTKNEHTPRILELTAEITGESL